MENRYLKLEVVWKDEDMFDEAKKVKDMATQKFKEQKY